MKSVISYTAPKFHPLPTSITEADIRDATLPVKIEAARRAIQQCEDLPELLRYQDQAQGLAAAVRIMKHVAPELVRSANEMVADAWQKGGELLSQYSSRAIPAVSKGIPVSKQRVGASISPRGAICKDLGITPTQSSQMVRIASASPKAVYEIINTTSCLSRVAKRLPRIDSRGAIQSKSVAYGSIMSGGLTSGLSFLKHIPLEAFKQLASDERKLVKAKIAEAIELLDEMDRLCR